MKKILNIVPLFVFLFVAPLVSGVFAGTLSFDPSSVNVEVGETFTLTVQADVGDAEVLGIDALIEYDKDKLTVKSMSDGTFLNIETKQYDNPGKIYAAGVVSSAGESVTGSGPLVDITFEATAGGTSTISFVCEIGETGESNISENSPDVTDLIECSQNGEAVVVVEGGTGGDDTTTGDTTTGGSTTGELPQTGIVEDIFVLSIIAGGLLFAFGLGTRIFT